MLEPDDADFGATCGALIEVAGDGGKAGDGAPVSKMLAETGIALLANKGDGGVWTPGALLGEALIDRLTANAGLTFQIED